jgi:hypothetical protein
MDMLKKEHKNALGVLLGRISDHYNGSTQVPVICGLSTISKMKLQSVKAFWPEMSRRVKVERTAHRNNQCQG